MQPGIFQIRVLRAVFRRMLRYIFQLIHYIFSCCLEIARARLNLSASVLIC